MPTVLEMGLRAFMLLASRVWTCISFLIKKKIRSGSKQSRVGGGVRDGTGHRKRPGTQRRDAQHLSFTSHNRAVRSDYKHVRTGQGLGKNSIKQVVVRKSKIRTIRRIVQHQPVKYEIYPLSPLSRHRLSLVRRKVLVLDLDETLIHSHHEGVVRQTVKPGTPPDFVLKVTIERHPVRFFVHKRPHVDFFLDIVSQWYELVVFTASMEIYGAGVADKLDNDRGILRRRYYRQHCTPDLGSYTKDLSAISGDLANIFILDNSPGAYRAYPDNAIPIKSWFNDPMDTALLNLLPVLDALRFTQDVRSVLSRNLHLHRLW